MSPAPDPDPSLSPRRAEVPPATTPPRLAVVIVNYNGWPDVVRLGGSLAGAPEVADGRCELLVIDNASDGPVPPELDPAPRGLRLIVREHNDGFAAGVNTGWRAAQSPWLLLLNPDVVAGPDLIGRVLERIEALETRKADAVGLVGFGLRNPDGSRQGSVGAEPGLARAVVEVFLPRSRRKYKAGWRTRPGPVPWVTGAAALVRSAVLAEVGGMDEAFFLYYEEVALCRAARDRGWTVRYDPSLEVVHERPLQGRPVSPALRVITRHSLLLYYRTHLPRQFPWLSRCVGLEARARGAWARLRGRQAERRAWGLVARLAPAMRAGSPLRGRAVLELAQAALAGQPAPIPGPDA